MMKNTTLDARTYSFSSSDRLLFDANIWLFIYGPPRSPTDDNVRTYSGVMSDALKTGSQLFIDTLVLSEFINRFARLEHQVLISSDKAPKEFKRFRDSADFKLVSQAIADNVRRILKHCLRIESGFKALDIAEVLSEFEKGQSDFNDQVLAALCRSRDLTLVTHDADFKDCGLTVITANRRLLA